MTMDVNRRSDRQSCSTCIDANRVARSLVAEYDRSISAQCLRANKTNLSPRLVGRISQIHCAIEHETIHDGHICAAGLTSHVKVAIDGHAIQRARAENELRAARFIQDAIA